MVTELEHPTVQPGVGYKNQWPLQALAFACLYLAVAVLTNFLEDLQHNLF